MITTERLRECFHYDPETGYFTWIKRMGKRGVVGRRAGYQNVHGYRGIRIDRHNYLEHRLAWQYMIGEWPKYPLDHINGIKTENRFSNLRVAPGALNNENLRRPNKNNRSGFLGIAGPYRGKWKAQIKAKGVWRYLGQFLTKEEAHAAYIAAKRELHDGCTI